MENQLFNLKFTSKQLEKQSVRSEKSIKTEKAKLKKAIEKGNLEAARVHAENAIRKKSESINYLKLASRIEAVASRVETAVRMKAVTRSMASVVGNMERAMSQMDMAKISEIMDTFEKQFEDLDVKTNYIHQVVGTSTSLSTPVEEVDCLIQQVADEHGLDVNQRLGLAGPPTTTVRTEVTTDQDDLMLRLERLRS
eukprot:TRINITY_DN917_c1_g1_i1.p1 TRINITY_DN917_c1_g1~~TRINITY_DN917_c1_g1_i1.p1  ORF type:complete len:196 (-),score=103.81 TRINITY_DN917_c1_g1_i1:134-721(-)